MNKHLAGSVLVLFLLIFSPMYGFASQARDVTVTIALYDAGMPPLFQESEKSGVLEGVWIDMIEALFIDELDWQVKYLLRPWPRAQNEVRLGNADLFITIPTEERLRFTRSTEIPFSRLPLNLYTYVGHPKEKEIGEIRTVKDILALDLLVVSNLGNGWHKANIESKGVKTYLVKEDEQIAQFLAMKRADAMIDVPISMNRIIRRLGLEDRLVQTNVVFGPIDFYIMVGKNSPLAGKLPDINAALKKLTDNGVFDAIYHSYE